MKFELKNKINPREKKLSEFVIFFLTIELLSVFACLSNDRQGGKRVNSGRVFFFLRKKKYRIERKERETGKERKLRIVLVYDSQKIDDEFLSNLDDFGQRWAASSKRRNCLVNGLLG